MTQVCDVFSKRVLPSSSGGKPKVISTVSGRLSPAAVFQGLIPLLNTLPTLGLVCIMYAMCVNNYRKRGQELKAKGYMQRVGGRKGKGEMAVLYDNLEFFHLF